VLLTRDLPRIRDWYETVLQATVNVEDTMLCFLSMMRSTALPSPVCHICRRGPQGRRSRYIHHIAFTYCSRDDLLRTYERLKRLGIEPDWPIHHRNHNGVTISMY
jgi:catechol-2,3-dioxygenase